MATTMFGSPGPPFDLHNGSWNNDELFDLPFLEDFLPVLPMTANEDLGGDAASYPAFGQPFLTEDLLMDESYTHPLHTNRNIVAANASAASDVSRSPGNRATRSHLPAGQSSFRHANRVEDPPASGSSLSPGTDQMILTPTSTLEYTTSSSARADDDGNDPEDSISPTSTNRTDNDYVFISNFRFSHVPGPSVGRQTAPIDVSRPPLSSLQTSGGLDVQPTSRGSSIAPSSMSYSSSGAAQWGSLTGASPGMDYDFLNQGDNNHSDPFVAFTNGSFNEPTPASTAPHCDDEMLADFGAFDDGGFNATLPYRGGATRQERMPATYATGSPFTQDYAHYPHQQHHQHLHQQQRRQQQQQQQQQRQRQPQLQPQQSQSRNSTFGQPANMQTQTDMRNLLGASSAFRPHLEIPSLSSDIVQQQTMLPSAQPNTGLVRIKTEPVYAVQRPSHPAIATVPSKHTPSPPQLSNRTAQSVSLGQVPLGPQNHAHGGSRRILARAPPHTAAGSSTRENRGPSQGPSGGKGGRKRDSHLTTESRKKSHAMRKIAACWRCALQRDPCDEGTPCNRCRTRYEKGQLLYFGCDRSKLPDFVYDFLPPSMTLMHQKQGIEDTVKDQVLEWDDRNPIDVYLSSGYGPALRWKLYEFRPRTDDLLGQFQYLQDPRTGRLMRMHKYSPPLGLMKLDSSDDSHFDEYLNNCLHPDHIMEFGWTCFEEESQVDQGEFQATLLSCMCKLYLETRDPDLELLLRDIIRMILITYIMGHTLTICEDTLSTVLGHVKLSQAGPPQKHTSPRLANRQLKFYFAILRGNIYEKILKWQQQILHTSGKKEESWLSSFCAMLGFAMVLEEVQRTLQIQADAKIAKNEMPHDQAETEARNACERIDERYRLLIGLFQCKYRDKKWGDNGSFGPSTPRFSDHQTNEFLGDVRQLLLERRDHLEHRKDVRFSRETSCLYTSRLVAHFLLPFLNLPRG